MLAKDICERKDVLSKLDYVNRKGTVVSMYNLCLMPSTILLTLKCGCDQYDAIRYSVQMDSAKYFILVLLHNVKVIYCRLCSYL